MKAIFFVPLVLLFVSCKDSRPADAIDVYFVQAQPVNDSELSQIPKKYRGSYMSEDSVMLTITEKIIYSEQIFVASVHQSESDAALEGFEQKGGKLIEKKTGQIWESRQVGDSIQFSSKEIDTVFCFSEVHKAKRINGKLVLSFKKDSLWIAKVMSLDSKTLKLKDFARPEDMPLLDAIIKAKSTMMDTDVYVLYPTRSEFGQILKLNDIGYDRAYKKMN